MGKHCVVFIGKDDCTSIVFSIEMPDNAFDTHVANITYNMSMHGRISVVNHEVGLKVNRYIVLNFHF